MRKKDSSQGDWQMFFCTGTEASEFNIAVQDMFETGPQAFKMLH